MSGHCHRCGETVCVCVECLLDSDTPRVEAVIDKVMAEYPGLSVRAQAKFYEEVHQELAPLSRQLERENAKMRAFVQDLSAAGGKMWNGNKLAERAQKLWMEVTPT